MLQLFKAIKNVVFVSLSFGYFLNLSAQTTVYTADLDSVIVQVGRQQEAIELMPYSVSVVDFNTLSSINNLLTIKEAFSSVPGVNIGSRFNPSQGDKIIIRGIGSRARFGVRGVKILLDEIPLTFPDGQSQLNNLDVGSLSKIEVLRGPNSTLYGNSSGGVISIKSNVFSDERLQIKPEFNMGSFGFKKISLGLSSEFMNGSAGINLYTADYNGFRNHSDAKFSGANFITVQHLSGSLDLTAVVNYFNAPYLLNPGSLNKSDADKSPKKARERIINSGSGKEVEQVQAGISFNYNFSSNSVFKTTFYGIHRSLLNAITTRIIELERFSYGIRSTFSSSRKLFDSNINLIAGFDYEVQDDERSEFENLGVNDAASIKADDIFNNLTYGRKLLNQDEIVKSTGVFSQLEFLPNENIKLSAGLRYDNFNFEAADKFLDDSKDDSGERDMDKFSPVVGASFKIFDSMILYGNISTAFQTPTTNELSNTPDGSGGFNRFLKPENIESLEIGLRGAVNTIGLNYDAVLYQMNIKDMLIPFQNESEETFYRNSGEVNNNGIEISLRWLPYKSAAAEFSYTYQDMKFEDFLIERNGELFQLGGNFVPGVPKHNFNFRLNSELFYGLSSQISINSVSKIYTNDFNGPLPGDDGTKEEFVNDGYAVVSLMLVYSIDLIFGKMNLKAGIENIFDERYNGSVVPNAFGNNFFEPASGRAFYAGVNVNIN